VASPWEREAHSHQPRFAYIRIGRRSRPGVPEELGRGSPTWAAALLGTCAFVSPVLGDSKTQVDYGSLPGCLCDEFRQQARHRLEHPVVLSNVVSSGELPRIVVTQPSTVVAVLPDQHSEGELDTDARITPHQRRSGSRVAKDHDLLRCELQARLLRRCGMIDGGEHGQAATRNRFNQPVRSLGVSGRASRYEHFRIVAEMLVCVQMDRLEKSLQGPRWGWEGDDLPSDGFRESLPSVRGETAMMVV
jgi:hypothetical protein